MRPQECGHIAHTYHSGISFTNQVNIPLYRPRVETLATSECAHSPHQFSVMRYASEQTMCLLNSWKCTNLQCTNSQTFNLFSLCTVKLDTKPRMFRRRVQCLSGLWHHLFKKSPSLPLIWKSKSRHQTSREWIRPDLKLKISLHLFPASLQCCLEWSFWSP